LKAEFHFFAQISPFFAASLTFLTNSPIMLCVFQLFLPLCFTIDNSVTIYKGHFNRYSGC
jgi:hypothetical protein